MEQNLTPTRALSHCQHAFGQPTTLRLVLWSTSLVAANLSLCPCEIMPKAARARDRCPLFPNRCGLAFVPFLSWPPGWGCSGTLSPNAPCLTSAVAARGHPRRGCGAAAPVTKATEGSQLSKSRTKCLNSHP